MVLKAARSAIRELVEKAIVTTCWSKWQDQHNAYQEGFPFLQWSPGELAVQNSQAFP
jgi:hypothetical protein